MDSSLAVDRFAPTDVLVAGKSLSNVVASTSRPGKVGAQLDRERPDLYPADLLSDSGPFSDIGPRSVVRTGVSRTAVNDFAGTGGIANTDSEAVGVEVWWLAHTLPRQEKALAAALYARDVPYYLPLVTRKSLSRGRTRVARVTLFPGYLFIYGAEAERLSALKTNRVLTVRRAPDGERLWSDLRRFYQLIAADAPLLPEATLVPGERVRVKAGPFRDQEGIVIRRNGKTRLLIAVDYLQQGASLEVDDCLLERV